MSNEKLGLIFVCFLVASLVSFVIYMPMINSNKNKYNSIENEYGSLLTSYNELIEKHNTLVNKYNKLNNKYTNCTNELSYYNRVDSKILLELRLSEEDFGYGGMYYSTGYYCVWTKNRDLKNIVYSEEHEICHTLVADDYKHFCEDDTNE